MNKVITIALAISLVAIGCTSKKPAAKKPSASPNIEAAAKPKNNVAQKIKGLKKYDGLFPIYQDTSTGAAYLLIKQNQLDKEYIYFAYSENGVVQAGHYRGNYRDNEVFSIRKRYQSIEWVKENTSFYFDSSSAIFKARKANISPSVLVSEEIIAFEKDSVYLISADKIFLTEALARVKSPSMPSPLAGMQFSLGSLNAKKTRYSRIRNYPQNVDLVVEYVFDNPSAFISGGNAVTDPRSVSIEMQHSIIEMPQNDFKPRRDDPRIGYFNQQVNDMTSFSPTPYRDVINRWHLVKKDPTAALSEPVEPITWWIENTTPVEYRETIRQAGLSWNKAFEKAGFKNAIKIEIQPDDADWDAGDIRYNVLRWTSSPTPPFGGYGPSFVNPRTGQILGADIMLEFVFLTNRLKQFDVFTAQSVNHEECENHDHHQCVAAAVMQHNVQLGQTHMSLLKRSPEEREKFIQSAIYYLILHEMGHTLGLMHNMKASQLWLPNEINDTTKTRSIGLIGSVMDYPAINLHPDAKKQGDYYTTTPGPYDMWAIEYGYSQALENPEEEERRLQKILSRSGEKMLTFGNDADDMRSPGKGIDPRVMLFDISGDAITYSSQRIVMLMNLLPDLKTQYKKEGEGYQALVLAFNTITGEVGNAANVISRYVGGVYVERTHVGQPEEKQPYTPVPLAEQKRAIQELNRLLFSPNAFKNAEGLYEYLQVQRRGFNFFSSGEDPKIHNRILQLQNGVMAHILHPSTLERMSNSQLYGNRYTVTEMLRDMENGIFNEDLGSSCSIARMNLQSAYLVKLIQIAGLKEKSNYDNMSKAAAYQTVMSIKNKLNNAVLKGDDNTKAHRRYLLFLIEQATKA